MAEPNRDSNNLETLPVSSAFSLEFPAILTAIVHPEESGRFSAEVPALPGCFTEGDTLEDLRENLHEAAEGWLKAHHDLFQVHDSEPGGEG